jgi:hypothetical protein
MLREAFWCATCARLVNINLILLLAIQHIFFVQEDETLAGDIRDNNQKGLGLRPFIPSSMTKSNQYWLGVKKSFAF